MIRPALIAALGAAVMAASACGGGDDDSADATPPRSAAEYRAAADAACAAFARTNDELVRAGTPQTLDEQERLDTALAEAADTQAETFAALAAPANLQSDHEALVANHRENADAYRRAAAAAGQNDADAHAAATEARAEVGNEQLRLSRALGLEACARVLPAAARGDVQAVTRRVLLGESPEQSCDGDVTEAFIASNLSGTREACIGILEGLRDDGATVDISSITGVDGVIASANVAFSTERGKTPRTLTYDLVWDEDASAWKINSAFDAEARLPE